MHDLSCGDKEALTIIVALALVAGAVATGFFFQRVSAGFMALAVEVLFLVWCVSQPE